MVFRLDEIEQNQKVEKAVAIDRHVIDAFAVEITLADVSAELTLSRRGKQAYEVTYRVSADAGMTCVRCGEPLSARVAEDGVIAVTDRQPDESHVVLSAAEMEVRFLAEPELDLDHLVLEICELGLPDYPKHDSCHGADLADAGAEHGEAEVAPPSPFQALSRFLDR